MLPQRQSKRQGTERKPKRRPRRPVEPVAERRRLTQAIWGEAVNWRDADGHPGVPKPGGTVSFEKR